MNRKKIFIPTVILILITLFISTVSIVSYALETDVTEAPVSVFEFDANKKYITNDNAGGSFSTSDNAYKLSGTGAKNGKDTGLTPNSSDDNTEEVIAERKAFMDYVEYVGTQTEPIQYMVLTYKNPNGLQYIKSKYHENNESNQNVGELKMYLFESDSDYYSVIVDVSGGKLLWRKDATKRQSNIALFPFSSLSSTDTNTYDLYLRSAAFTKSLEDAVAYCEEQIMLGNSDGYHVNGDDAVTIVTEDPIAVFDFGASGKYMTNINVTNERTSEEGYKLSGTGAKNGKDIGLTPNNSDTNTEDVIAERQAFMDYVEYVGDKTKPIKYMVLTYKNPDDLEYIKTKYNACNETYKVSGVTGGQLQIDLFDSKIEYYSVIVDVSGGKLIWRKSVTARSTNIALVPFAALSSDDANTYNLYLRSAAFTKTLDEAKMYCEEQIKSGNSDGYHVNGGDLVTDKPDITIDVSLDKHVYRMKAGDTLTLNTTVTSGASVSYTCSDASVVSVDESGVITAKANGKATVTVTAEYNGYKNTDSIEIFVNKIYPLTIVKKDGQEAPSDIPNITFLGDSITAGSQTSKIYHAYLADKLYITSLNKGLSGSNIAGVGSSNQESFIDRVSGISSDSDMIFVLGGINDFGQNKGTLERFVPGVRTLIESLIKNFPDKPILFSTPLQNGGYFSITTNKNGESLEQYVTEIETACAEYNIPVIKTWRADAFKDFCTYDDAGNVSGYNTTYYADGVHPNAAGHAVMADFFEAQLEESGVVTYKTAPSYTISATTPGNGTFTVNGGEAVPTYTGSASEGTTVTFVATANDGYKIDGWYDVTNGHNIRLTKDSTYTLTVSKNVEIEVRFIDETIKIPTKLAVSAGENGQVSMGAGAAGNGGSVYVDGGTTIAVTAHPADNYETAYWTRVTSDGATVYVGVGDTVNVAPLGDEVTYKPVFVGAGTKTALYLGAQGSIIGSFTGEHDAPSVPNRVGYTNGKWDAGTTSGNVTIYKATYTKNTTTNTLTINYADGSNKEISYKYNDFFTLTATKENTVWYIKIGEGVETVLSYASEFEFGASFTENITITEKEETSVAEAIVKGLEAVYDASAGKIKFVATFELPVDATLVERGVLLTSDSDIAASMEIGDPGVITGRVTAPVENATKVFIINKSKVTAGATWYGRPYIIYTQGGVTKTLYADTMNKTAE